MNLCVPVFLCNYSCLIEYTKAVIYTAVKVRVGTGQGPATEVTHLRLNQPPVFSRDISRVGSNFHFILPFL